MASGEALFNPYLPEFHADPYPFYHRLRAVAPVYQTPMGFWVLTRYDDVVTVLGDPRFGRDGSRTRTVWISRVETTGTSPSGLASTSVSARHWLGSKGRSPWAPSSASGQAWRSTRRRPGENRRRCAGSGHCR